MDFWFRIIEIVAGFVPAGVVVWQFLKTKKLKKRGCKKFCVYRNLRFPDKSSICKSLLSIF